MPIQKTKAHTPVLMKITFASVERGAQDVDNALDSYLSGMDAEYETTEINEPLSEVQRLLFKACEQVDIGNPDTGLVHLRLAYYKLKALLKP